MAWVDHPSSRDLSWVTGTVDYLQVDQMDTRDQVTVKLRSFVGGLGATYESERYTTYLDVGAAVALAQLLLLRQALVHQAQVEIGYLDDGSYRWMYSVTVLGSGGA